MVFLLPSLNTVINRNSRQRNTVNTMPTNGSNQMLNNSTKQVNKVKPNVNRQPPDSVVSPSTYNR
jgi:potassium large conductance calcium-activated channel subfamily M alpha member 1